MLIFVFREQSGEASVSEPGSSLNMEASGHEELCFILSSFSISSSSKIVTQEERHELTRPELQG